MVAVDIKIVASKPLPASVVKGHRIDSKIQEVDVRITPLRDKTHLRVGESNFLVNGEYYVGGHILCIRFGLTAGAQLIENFERTWSGVFGYRRLLEKTPVEALVEIDLGDVVDVFHADGVVSQITMDESRKIVKTVLQPEVALGKRLDVIGASFHRALARVCKTDEDKSEKTRKIDKQFHELAALLRLTALFPHLREVIIKQIAAFKIELNKQSDNAPLNKGVRIHLKESLRAIGDDRNYIWLNGYETIATAPVKDVRRLRHTSPLSIGRKTETQDEKRKRETRRDANRAARNADRPVKGPSGSADPHGNKGKHGRDKK